MSDLPIPATFENLTPEWLTSALRTHGLDGVTVREARVEMLATGGHGLLCHLGRVHLGYDRAFAGAPATLVAKLPKREAHVQEFGKMLRAWEMESRAYADLLPQLDVRTARCFYNGCDVAENSYALVLEDLGALTGADQLTGVSPAQAKLAIRWLAGLHAKWWGRAELAASDWLPSESAFDQRAHPMMIGFWDSFQTLFAADVPKRVFGWIERVLPTYTEPVRTKLPPTLLHHDVRADNLFFDGDRDMVAVDWQLVASGHGMLDVAYLIGTQMPIEQRRATERELLALYREELLARGVDPGSFEDVLALYRLYLLRLAAYVIIAVSMMNDPDPIAPELARNGVARAAAAADDHDVGELLD
jgi:hypothetical protein